MVSDDFYFRYVIWKGENDDLDCRELVGYALLRKPKNSSLTIG